MYVYACYQVYVHLGEFFNSQLESVVMLKRIAMLLKDSALVCVNETGRTFLRIITGIAWLITVTGYSIHLSISTITGSYHRVIGPQ